MFEDRCNSVKAIQIFSRQYRRAIFHEPEFIDDFLNEVHEFTSFRVMCSEKTETMGFGKVLHELQNENSSLSQKLWPFMIEPRATSRDIEYR